MMSDAPIVSPPVPRERPGLFDALILAAAFALGLAWTWSRWDRQVDVGWTFITPDSIMSSGEMVGQEPYRRAVPILASVTLGLALVQLRRAGGPSDSLFARRGLLACVSASIPILFYLARWAGATLFDRMLKPSWVPGAGPPPGLGFDRLMEDLAYPAGIVVAATWLVARLGPPRPAQPD